MKLQRRIREFLHRGRHGWAPSDTWDLDHYLAGVIGQSVRHLAANTHGWPGDGSEWSTAEEWSAELRQHADLLIAYSADNWLEEFIDPRPSIRRLGEFWWHLWD